MAEPFDLVVSNDLKAKIEQEANRLNMSIDEFVDLAISKHLNDLDNDVSRPVVNQLPLSKRIS